MKAQIMMVAGSMLEEERLWTGSDPLFSIDHEKSAMDERPKSQSPVQPKKKSDRRDFIVRMGGVKLEDGYFLTHYKIQDGSVVHPEWESVDLAPTYSTAFLSAVDPDWWNEAHRQTIENIRYGWAHLRWPTFEDLRRIGPDLIWPGPLVVRRNKPDGGEEETRHRKPRKEEEEEEESQYSEEQEEEWEEERGRAPHVRDTQPPPRPQSSTAPLPLPPSSAHLPLLRGGRWRRRRRKTGRGRSVRPSRAGPPTSLYSDAQVWLQRTTPA